MINVGTMMVALLGISIFTSLTTEAFKKVFDDLKIKYSANIMVVVIAIALTLIVSTGYIIYTGMAVTVQVVIAVIALTFLSFLVATVGYDKVIQAIEQIKDIIG